MRKFPALIPLVLVAVLLLSQGACTPAAPSAGTPVTEAAAGESTNPPAESGTVDERPYPIESPTPEEEPTAAVEPYPVAAETVPFSLDRPLSPGMTVLSGSGPANVPVRVLLEDGTALAELIIGEDGRFELEVPALESGQRVGIMLDDLTGTQWNPDELNSATYHGPGSVNIPALGFFLDTVLVQ